MVTTIAPIVEGRSEVDSVPVLLRRIFHSLSVYDVTVARPFWKLRTQIVREGELEKAIEFTIKSRKDIDCILLIMDADDDCPAELGPALLRRAEDVTDLPVSIVLAQKEFECWFLGAKESLRGKRGIRDDATSPPNPEQIRGAKERLSRNMTKGVRYRGVEHQAGFAECMDIDQARSRCPSFARLVRVIEDLIKRKD